jgi:hypothetical protein
MSLTISMLSTTTPGYLFCRRRVSHACVDLIHDLGKLFGAARIRTVGGGIGLVKH